MTERESRAQARAARVLLPGAELNRADGSDDAGHGAGRPASVAEPATNDEVIPGVRRGRLRSASFRALSFVTMFAVWQIASFFFEDTVLPAPWAVLQAMVDNFKLSSTFGHIGATVGRVVLAMALAVLGGLLLGLLMGLLRRAEQFLDSWVMVGLTIPAVVYGIVGILWFGLNSTAAVVAIALTCLPTVALNIWQGTKAIDMSLVHMGKAFRFPRGTILRWVVIPQVIPYLLSAFRYALGIGWKTATVVELIGLNTGVGYQLSYWFGLYNMTQVFAWTLTFTLVLLIFEYLVIKPVEGYLTRWRISSHGS